MRRPSRFARDATCFVQKPWDRRPGLVFGLASAVAGISRHDDRTRPGINAQLGENTRYVIANSLLAHAKVRGDLMVVEPACEKVEQFSFALGELGERTILGDRWW